MHEPRMSVAAAALAAILSLACPVASGVTDGRNLDWPRHGNGPAEQRHSALAQVHDRNVDKLAPAWFLDMPFVDDGLAATPIIRDGVIYMTGSFARIYAVDGVSGELLWDFDPLATVHSGTSNSWAARVNRGVAVDEEHVYVGTPDCRLVAVGRESGERVWEKLTCDPAAEYAITGAPRIVGNKVIIGNGISDFGARGYVSAYDRADGSLLWRFYTVPGNPENGRESKTMEMAAKTWADGWARYGGASPWDAIVYDPDFNRIYIGTDSAIPYDPSERSPGGGDNLFTNSIVALDADTGEYAWHYQTVPNDAWDYNAANHIILAEIEFSGRKRKVLMQAPKNGFFYVLDRENGELLSAEPYVGVTWAKKIDLKTGRPVEAPGARYYRNESRQAQVIPSIVGAHNWHPMSYSPQTGLVYIPAHEFQATYRINPDAALGGVMVPLYGDDLNEERTDLRPEKRGTIGRLVAWDPLAGKEKWHVDHALPMNGGVLSTAGNLVFQGTATGEFDAYAADTGKHLWRYPVQASVQAPPVSYMVDGKQYVLASVGGGGIARFMIPLYGTGKKALGPSRLIAFAIDGDKELPAFEPEYRPVPNPPEQTADAAQIELGAELYEVAACGLCHGSVTVGRRPTTSVPDLRYMSAETHRRFEDIVLKGYKRPAGMIPFEGILEEKDVEAIHAYIIDRQWELFRRTAQADAGSR